MYPRGPEVSWPLPDKVGHLNTFNQPLHNPHLKLLRGLVKLDKRVDDPSDPSVNKQNTSIDKLDEPSDCDDVNSYYPLYSEPNLDNTQKEHDDSENQVIQTVMGNRTNVPEGWIDRTQQPFFPRDSETRNNNITIRRDNRKILASKLPTIFVTNHRSFFPKFSNFVEAMKTLDLTLGCHSEIWEDKENKRHMSKIEEALEIQGIQYISNPRPDRRGGGAAISLLAGDFVLTKLDVIQPNNLEVVWGLVKPRGPTSNVRILNVRIAFYYQYFTAS